MLNQKETRTLKLIIVYSYTNFFQNTEFVSKYLTQ
jgi:hypothetical protein